MRASHKLTQHLKVDEQQSKPHASTAQEILGSTTPKYKRQVHSGDSWIGRRKKRRDTAPDRPDLNLGEIPTNPFADQDVD